MNCRSCGLPKTTRVFSLGNMPLANALLDSPYQPTPTYPLDLMFCEQCSLLQIMEIVPPEKLFTDSYVYQTAYSKPVSESFRLLAERVFHERRLHPYSLVIDIGCNDGTLLSNYERLGTQTLGVDPARNVCDVARARGIPVINAFFGRDFGDKHLPRHEASVIHAQNVLAHAPDPNSIMEGIAHTLGRHGIAIIEVPYVRNLIDYAQFDTIYHEHVFYFSLTALRALVERNGLVLNSVERIDNHGGSLRLWVSHSGKSDDNVGELLLAEKDTICTIRYYRDFMARCELTRFNLRRLLGNLRRRGLSVCGFGAPAKATTLLNFCGIGPNEIHYVLDDTPSKVGKFIPGVAIPILSVESLAGRFPHAIVLLCWNLLDAAVLRLGPWCDDDVTELILPINDQHTVQYPTNTLFDFGGCRNAGTRR